MIWMAGFLRWFSPRRLLYIAAALAVAFAVWQAAVFIDAKYAAEARVAELSQELAAREEAIRILNKAIRQREAAQEVADATRDEIEESRSSAEDIRRSVAAASEEENGTLAPVLRDALRSVDGLR